MNTKVNIYQNGDRFLITGKTIKDTAPERTGIKSIETAFDVIMDELYEPAKGAVIRIDEKLKDEALRTDVPDIEECEFITVS